MHLNSDDRSKPIKVSILQDTGSVTGHWNMQKDKVAGLYQYIHSLTYGYAYAMPFPMGPTAFPAPLQYCKNVSRVCKFVSYIYIDLFVIRPCLIPYDKTTYTRSVVW